MYPKALRLEVARVIEQNGPLSLFDIKRLVGASICTTDGAISNTVENMTLPDPLDVAGRKKTPHRHEGTPWLEIVGSEKQPQCHKWVNLFDLAQPVEEAQPVAEEGVAALCAVLVVWGAPVRCPVVIENDEVIYA